MLGRCSDKDRVVGVNDVEAKFKNECIGNFTTTEDVYVLNRWNHTIEVSEEREWSVPINNYDNILTSMLTFFEISTLEMWPDMMFDAIDSVGLD